MQQPKGRMDGIARWRERQRQRRLQRIENLKKGKSLSQRAQDAPAPRPQQ